MKGLRNYGRYEGGEEKAKKDFYERANVKNGVVRWNSNDSVPPSDILEDWATLGLPFDLEASQKARDEQVSKFLNEYRESRQESGYSSEEMFEMRAAFGEGAEVVDVITGQKIKL